jgi:hypothetical protein
MYSFPVRSALAALVPLLVLGAAACGRSGTGSSILTPSDVGGVYAICSLTFTPAGPGRPPLDLRAVMDTTPRAGLPTPQLRLSSTRYEFVLEYVPPGDFVERQFRHTYRTGPRTVMIDFPDPAQVMAALLLPPSLEMEYRESPRSLRITDAYREHRVPRADYQRLAGIEDPNLADPVLGTLSGQFVSGGCN